MKNFAHSGLEPTTSRLLDWRSDADFALSRYAKKSKSREWAWPNAWNYLGC